MSHCAWWLLCVVCLMYNEVLTSVWWAICISNNLPPPLSLSLLSPGCATEEETLETVRVILTRLPPPHYNTLKFLIRHLYKWVMLLLVTNCTMRNFELSFTWLFAVMGNIKFDGRCIKLCKIFSTCSYKIYIMQRIILPLCSLSLSNSPVCKGRVRRTGWILET